MKNNTKQNNWVNRLLKAIFAVSILSFIAIYFLTGGRFFTNSGISNCVIVNDEKDFTGTWLKHSRAVLYSRIPTTECIERDKQIDSGDGPKKGKVRWAECSAGPDCDEAGMY